MHNGIVLKILQEGGCGGGSEEFGVGKGLKNFELQETVETGRFAIENSFRVPRLS
jgi:hypothetical protein